MTNRFLLLVSSLLLFSCSNEKSKQNVGSNPANTQHHPKTVSHIEERLFRADSLEVIYYDDPDGDSTRYTRYFTFTATNDTGKVNTFLREINQVFVQQPATRKCRSEGKIFLLQGEDVLKTIYFSLRNDSCNYFYFIKDGNFIYVPVTNKASLLVKDLNKMAKKP